MEVVMVGTPTCIRCKSLAPKLEEYCREHDITYTYMNLGEAPPEIVNLLVSKNIKSAPAFLIYKGEDTVVVSGDSIFLELESL